MIKETHFPIKRNLLDCKKGDIIKFDKHFHFIIKEQIDFSYQIGRICFVDKNQIGVQLLKKHEDLLDWKNCLIFGTNKNSCDFYELDKINLYGNITKEEWEQFEILLNGIINSARVTSHFKTFKKKDWKQSKIILKGDLID